MAVVTNWQITGVNPVTVGGTGTAPKYFTVPSGNFTAGPATTPNAANATGQLAVPGSNQLNGQRFKIVACGDFEVGTGGACPNVTIDIVANIGTLVAPIYTVLATTGAIVAQTAVGIFYPWYIVADVIGTTAAGTLGGTQAANVDNTVVAAAALTHTLSGLNFSGVSPVFGLAVRTTFSVSESGNSANMYQFGIYQD